MPPAPRYRVLRADGGEAAELYDLPHQGLVCLHGADPELVRRLQERGLFTSARPPFLDAAGHGVHGKYAPRAQINWFLAPPIERVVSALEEALREARYSVVAA